MAPNRLTSGIDYTKTQLALFFVILLLAVDGINPVKMFLHVFPQVLPWHIAIICIGLMIYVFISEMKELLYFSVKVFFFSILSIFFRSVEIIGRDNIPRHGPVIFTINHANQFIDGLMILCTCQHKISYLVAEKSWKRRVVGHIAWAMGAVPVKRAQDSSLKGTGTITFIHLQQQQQPQQPQLETNNSTDTQQQQQQQHLIALRGENTKFTTELTVGDKIRPAGSSTAFKITQIHSDTSLHLLAPLDVDTTATLSSSSSSSSSSSIPTTSPNSPALTFDIMKRVDQTVVYAKVLDKLAEGGAIGIFPEGGSHDRTDLLPLKVGVAIIAYAALDKDSINIPIVPVGLNYFNAHRFRGRAIVEYGRPVYIDSTTLDAYKQGGSERRRVCNHLLQNIEFSMRSVIVSTPDYEVLRLVCTARRLYQSREESAFEKQDLNRRFAEAYKQLLLRTKGEFPPEWRELQERIVDYQDDLDYLGVRDYQVPGLDRQQTEEEGDKVLRIMRLSYRIVHLILLLFLAALPGVLLNFPVGLIARKYADRRRKLALAKSKVKIQGLDVVLSEKVLFCIVMVPTLWITYGLLLFLLTDMSGPAIALAVLSMPMFSYMGIMAAEAGMVDWKDLKPFVKRLLPSTKMRSAELPSKRRALKNDLQTFIRMIGPSLGEIYTGTGLDWTKITEESKRNSILVTEYATKAMKSTTTTTTDEVNNDNKDD